MEKSNDNLLYSCPKESPESRERTKAEMEVPDPEQKRVVAILLGVPAKPEKETLKNESQPS